MDHATRRKTIVSRARNVVQGNRDRDKKSQPQPGSPHGYPAPTVGGEHGQGQPHDHRRWETIAAIQNHEQDAWDHPRAADARAARPVHESDRGNKQQPRRRGDQNRAWPAMIAQLHQQVVRPLQQRAGLAYEIREIVTIPQKKHVAGLKDQPQIHHRVQVPGEERHKQNDARREETSDNRS